MKNCKLVNYFKKVRKYILKGEMEYMPVNMLLNEHEEYIFDAYLNSVDPLVVAIYIGNQA